jgi:hypothetical protein
MYFMLKSVYDVRYGTRYFLIIAREKIDRIAKLRSFRSIAYADEVYPVTVQELFAPAGIEDCVFDMFLRTVPQNVWMDSNGLRKLIDEFMKNLNEGFTAWLSKVASNWVPPAPKGRNKEKYPKVLDYWGSYAPYRYRVVARLKKSAVNVVKINRRWSIYFFKRSFAIDENRDCMVFLPYDVSLIDAEKVYEHAYAIESALRAVIESKLDLPENIRTVIDCVWLIVGTAGK